MYEIWRNARISYSIIFLKKLVIFNYRPGDGLRRCGHASAGVIPEKLA